MSLSRLRWESRLRSGELALYLPLRFYMMDCSKAKLCANYTEAFPSLFCFRPKFLLKFHRKLTVTILIILIIVIFIIIIITILRIIITHLNDSNNCKDDKDDLFRSSQDLDRREGELLGAPRCKTCPAAGGQLAAVGALHHPFAALPLLFDDLNRRRHRALPLLGGSGHGIVGASELPHRH